MKIVRSTVFQAQEVRREAFSTDFISFKGGMKAVVWTDVVQMCLMFFGLVMVFTKATYDVGGLPEVFRRANEAGRLNLFRSDRFELPSTTPNLERS